MKNRPEPLDEALGRVFAQAAAATRHDMALYRKVREATYTKALKTVRLLPATHSTNKK